MNTYEISQIDNWFYTGLPIQQYEDAKRKGVIEPIDLGDTVQQQSGIGYGLVISQAEAFIDGFIEGYLTRIYGEGQFTKVSVKIPRGTLMYYDVIDKGVPLSYIVTISIPITDSVHVETWKCGPQLAEGIICEYGKEQEFGKKLPPVEPPSLG